MAKISAAWRQAQKRLAWGVDSPVRAFGSVGGQPVFMERGRGAMIRDDRGRAYIDFCLSWGALLRGHAYGPTVTAVTKQSALGTSFGTATELETALAGEVQKVFPGMQRLRFTSSGTEAAMSAIRLARGYTGKERLLKFEGCYHGHSDSLLVKAGSGLATFGKPDSAGVPRSVASLTSVLPYNDAVAARRFFSRTKDLAGVIVEPVAANMGVVPATHDFLQALREGADRTGALLILDEVITGFRLRYGGAQHVYDIKPDLTLLGKIIGGGLPIGAFGGAKRIMDRLSPGGDVYQAGTLSGNPLSMAAGLSVLKGLDSAFYERLNRRTAHFAAEFQGIFHQKRIPVALHCAGSMFTAFFGVRRVRNFSEASKSDKTLFRRFFHHALRQGLYFPPSAFEASFICDAHDERNLKKTLEVARRFA